MSEFSTSTAGTPNPNPEEEKRGPPHHGVEIIAKQIDLDETSASRMGSKPEGPFLPQELYLRGVL